MVVKIIKLQSDAIVPVKAYSDDAGFDLFAAKDAVIGVGEYALIPTGIAMELPPKTEAQIRPRSGLALKHGVTVLNSPGTVDCGYRGEVGVILINQGKADFTVQKGMRIAQIVFATLADAELTIVEEMTDSKRSVGGFGSTDKSDNT